MNGTKNNNSIDELAGKAGAVLGTSGDEVKKAAQSGDLAKLLSRLTPSQTAQLKRILSDEKAAKKLLATSQAQALLRGLKKE